jgi:hypothetical protein
MSALEKIFNDANATETQQLQAALLELSVTSGLTGADDRAKDAWGRIEKVAQGKTAAARDALVLLAQRELSQRSEVNGSQGTNSSTTQQLNNSIT